MRTKTWLLVITVAGLLGGTVGCSYHYDRDHDHGRHHGYGGPHGRR